MPKISCSVGSCSYNRSGMCGASALKVVGDGANITEQTSCSTYINKERANNSLDQEVKRGETERILCEVETCSYHKDNFCALPDGIEVGTISGAEVYTDTDCLSFERRSY